MTHLQKAEETGCSNCHAVSFCVGEFCFRSLDRVTCNLTIVLKDFTLSLQEITVISARLLP